MSRPRGARRVAAVVIATTVALAGCAGVPTSSAPQTVASIGQDLGQDAQVYAPPRNAGAREIVTDFLQANAINPNGHASAREYLTSAQSKTWSDATATVINDFVPGTYDARTRTLPVSGRVVGRLDKNGIYQPTTEGSGGGGATEQFVFHLAVERGQYRISKVPDDLGLLLTEDQFASFYQPRVLFFFDSADQYLVPDLRYSALTDPDAVGNWLVGELVQGPRPGLQNVVSTDTLPANALNTSVTVGAVTDVRVAGARQLSGVTRNRLAAQLSATLSDLGTGTIRIMDGSTPVVVPLAHGTQFRSKQFPSVVGPYRPRAEVYYLSSSGRIRHADGSALRGAAGNASFAAAALARPSSGGQLLVAAEQDVVGGAAGQQETQLLIGTAANGVRTTSLRGVLTRPSWAPGAPGGVSEVWVGSGKRIYRVTYADQTAKVQAVPLSLLSGKALPADARIVALRISPDGTRIAVVYATGGRLGGQLTVGSIVRNNATVVVTGLQPISPSLVRLTDVAWADSLKLYATGYVEPSKDAGVFESGVDGADWTDLGLSGLPDKADSITATTEAQAWVESNGYVWQQGVSGSRASTTPQGVWVSPGPQDQVSGSDPMYIG